MRILMLMFVLTLTAWVLWFLLFPRVPTSVTPGETPIKRSDTATATDPYLRSIQEAQTVREVMERSNARVGEELAR